MKTTIHVSKEEQSIPKDERHLLVETTRDNRVRFMLADENGERTDYCPHLFHITEKGTLSRAECVNQEVAKQYGLQLDDKGRIVLED